MSSVANEQAHPVSYFDRVNPLRADHPAYALFEPGADIGMVVQQGGLAAFLESERDRYSVTYESRTVLAGPPSAGVGVLEFLLAATAGAAMVIGTDGDSPEEVASLLETEWVTHAFVPLDVLTSADPDGLDDLKVVVILGGNRNLPPDRSVGGRKGGVHDRRSDCCDCRSTQHCVTLGSSCNRSRDSADEVQGSGPVSSRRRLRCSFWRFASTRRQR